MRNTQNQYREKTTICQIEFGLETFQPAFTCSKLTKETLEQGVKYVQS